MHIYLVSTGQTDEVGLFPIRAFVSWTKAVKYKERLDKEKDKYTYYQITTEILDEETE